MNNLTAAVQYVVSIVGTWFNFPLPGTNIGVGYLFFAAISIPVVILIVHRFIRGL